MRRVRRFAGAAFVLVVLKTATRVLAPRRVTVFVGGELGFLGVAPWGTCVDGDLLPGYK